MKYAQVPHIQTHSKVEEEIINFQISNAFYSCAGVRRGVVRVVSFSVVFYLDNECGK
jgi:hypothetical protein